MINRKLFFFRIRKSLFAGRIGSRQIEGMNAILNTWFEIGSKDLRQLAYILATAYHETAWTFQPIKERGGTSYLTNNYDVTGSRPRLARANGNIRVGDGARYAGRGFVQLTWRNNYRFVGQKLGLDLESNPQLTLRIDTASIILVRGMMEGWFTGRKLTQYFNGETADWMNARRTVNGVDKARSIAAQGKLFLAAMVLDDMVQSEQMKVVGTPRTTEALPPKPRRSLKIKSKSAPLLQSAVPSLYQMPPLDGRSSN
jgi:putative chitinase